MMTQHNTIIIGGGPGGASAAIYLARFFHEVTLLDASETVPGRTVLATHHENYLGNVGPTTGEEFLKRVRKQLASFGVEPVQEKATRVSGNGDDSFTITTDTLATYHAKYVIVAVGLGDTMPQIEGLDPYYEHAIFHCLTCDWYWNRNKKATVVTNNDAGITTAIMIQTLHKPPILSVVPAESPRYSSQMVDKAERKGIAVYASPLRELHGKDGYLHAISLEDGTSVDTEVLFTHLGHTRNDQFLDAGGIQVEREPEEGFMKVNFQTFETSVTNLFAVGPCNEGPDQAIIAGGQGALAALEIHRRIVDGIGM